MMVRIHQGEPDGELAERTIATVLKTVETWRQAPRVRIPYSLPVEGYPSGLRGFFAKEIGVSACIGSNPIPSASMVSVAQRQSDSL